MSVLSRRHTVPAQRGHERVIDLDAPAPASGSTATAQAPAGTDKQRTALLIAGAAIIVAAAIGTTTALLNDDGTPSGAPASTGVGASVLESEAKRDAAAASRYVSR